MWPTNKVSGWKVERLGCESALDGEGKQSVARVRFSLLDTVHSPLFLISWINDKFSSKPTLHSPKRRSRSAGSSARASSPLHIAVFVDLVHLEYVSVIGMKVRFPIIRCGIRPTAVVPMKMKGSQFCRSVTFQERQFELWIAAPYCLWCGENMKISPFHATALWRQAIPSFSPLNKELQNVL